MVLEEINSEFFSCFSANLCTNPVMVTVKQGIPTSIMNWNAEDQQVTFQEFSDMAKLYLEVKGIEKNIMWKQIIFCSGKG